MVSREDGKVRNGWTDKDTVLLSCFVLIVALLGMLVWSGFSRQALEDERDSLFVDNANLQMELRDTLDGADLWHKQMLIYKDELDAQASALRICKNKVSYYSVNGEKASADLDKCWSEYDFMRESLLNDYDVDVDTFPELINGLYVDGVVHAQVNSDMEQGLNTLCHEYTHYLIDENYNHFCKYRG